MRIAIINESAAAVEAMKRIVRTSEALSVAWVTHDGTSAVNLCATDKPDLILMGINLPGLDGAKATREIMARTPCPIIVVTVDATANDARIFETMGAGALDALNAPGILASGSPHAARALLAKIETIRRLTGTVAHRASRNPAPLPARRPAAHCPPLVAIGASAGGPAALAQLLGHWRPDFPGAVVVVQHVDAEFAPGFADWLGSRCALPVRLALEGDRLTGGHVLLADGRGHLVFEPDSCLHYSRRPRNAVVELSVDVFFQSILAHWRGPVVAALLTGMGRDGAAGLQLLRAAGHHTIAQDEATSAVYGMPRAAVELGAAREILPLESIAPRISMILSRTRKV
jgi:two-component system, chemotaxis family, response regulator WspF